MKTIAIIGFGFCGRMAFYHLSEKPREDIRIIIFDPSGDQDFGPAFSNFSPHYILNVPTAKMSAFSDKPGDFCQFLIKQYPEIWQQIGPDGFAPRHIYGEYLDAITKKAFYNAKKNKVTFDFISEEVVKISEDFILTTKSNKFYQASEILLASGIKQAQLPFSSNSPNYIKNLWHSSALAFHQKQLPAEKICLIGSGLTAVDMVVNLSKNNFAGEIIIISRRGNLPKKHFTVNPISSKFINPEDARSGLLALVLRIRKFLQQNKDCDLRQAIDLLRPITQELWHNLDFKNKLKFLKILPYWNIFRHRSPSSSIDLIESMINSGQIKLQKNGFKNIEEKAGQFVIKTKDEKIVCDYLVNCLGFEFNADKYPLFKQMIASGLLIKDLLLVKSNNQKIHLLGGLNIGHDFECTSVPDLRTSVENTVNNLINR